MIEELDTWSKINKASNKCQLKTEQQSSPRSHTIYRELIQSGSKSYQKPEATLRQT